MVAPAHWVTSISREAAAHGVEISDASPGIGGPTAC